MTPDSLPPRQRKSLKNELRAAWRRLRGGTLSPGRAAASLGVGLFVGCLPLYGAHLWIVLAVCVPLRLDAAIAYVATHVSNPLTLPLVLALEVKVGSLVTGYPTTLGLDAARRFGWGHYLALLGAGGLVVSTVAAIAGATVTFVVMRQTSAVPYRERARARRRTLARYAAAPANARGYVAGRLLTDPALAAILSLPGSFGEVVDLGCGYGHVGLSLLENGRAARLAGFDTDAGRIAVARGASLTGVGPARFETGDLERSVLPPADTILLLESLHYVPKERQDAVLARAALHLSPGGRLIVREVVTQRSLRSRLTQWLERRMAASRGHRAVYFREMNDLVRTLEELGLECSLPPDPGYSVLDNMVVVGTKDAPPSA